MRLIDLDEIEYFTLVDKWGTPRYKVEIGEGLPIVDAIPIEWLKQLKQRYLEENCLMSYAVINEIQNLWQKEKERL